jgi:hypothetical protein
VTTPRLRKHPSPKIASMEYPNDLIDGREVPQLVITSDHVLVGTHTGTIQVESGHLEVRGTNQGTLNLHPGATATISGSQQGTVSVSPGASVQVTGAIEGTTNVSQDAGVIVEPGGKLAGTLHNDGSVVIRGVFGGVRSGQGSLLFEDQGYEKAPVVRDGVHYYEW